MFHYLKHTLFLVLALPVIVAATLGGHFLWYGLIAALVVIVLGDLTLGDDVTEPKYRFPWLLDLQLYASLPITIAFWFVMMWHGAGGASDPLGYGALVERLTGYDALAARNATTAFDYVGGLATAALYLTLMSTIIAHELTHRTWDAKAMFVGRWLLAWSWDVGFAIEHVYGHHVYVATTTDPATAARGTNVYVQALRAIVRTNVNAWVLEQERLRRKRLPTLSLHNAFLRGQLMSLGLAAASFAIGGGTALFFFVVIAFGAKTLLEVVNYMEHYGLVRVPGQPVQPRHSWNANQRMSSWATFNLTRHSHHHAQGEVPFWALRPYHDAPMMIGGYLSTLLVALVPPVWHALMTPKLLDWDRRHASPEELRLAGLANAKSGIPALMAHTYGATERETPAIGAASPA